MKLGIEEAPCVIAKNLTDKQVKAYRLADNKVAEIAEWDFELLESEFEAIEDLGGFNMADFGFEELNTESIMDDLDDVGFNKGETTEFHLTLTFTKEENEYIESFLKDKSKVDLKNFLIEKLKGGA